jgi:hypothetical protein
MQEMRRHPFIVSRDRFDTSAFSAAVLRAAAPMPEQRLFFSDAGRKGGQNSQGGGNQGNNRQAVRC